MEAKTQSIQEVFHNNTQLLIPYYQRQYVWNEEKDHNWSRFCSDLESILESDRNYFLGALIFKHENVSFEDTENGISTKMTVVDGQQRLTTLTIYMKILHMLTAKIDDFRAYYQLRNGAHDPILKHNYVDRVAFEEIVKLETPIETLQTNEGNIASAYHYFLNRFKELSEKGVSLNRLLNVVDSRIKFVVIELNREDDEQQIFDTINSLGVDLTTDELMKNYLYEPNDEGAYNRTWRLMFDVPEAKKFWGTDVASARQSKSRDGKMIDRFMHAFVRIKMWDFKDRLTEKQKTAFVKTENIYFALKSFHEEFGMAKQDLANEILDYAKIFQGELNIDVLNTRIPDYSCKERVACFMYATKSFAILPYVLFVIKNVTSIRERNDIFGYLEKYLMRRYICKSRTNDYSDLFSQSLIGAENARTCKQLMDYIAERRATAALAMPDDNTMNIAAASYKYDETMARTILYMYETKHSSYASGLLDDSYNNFYAEQLMPKPCSAANINWIPCQDKDDEAARAEIVATIGNWFLLHNVNDKLLKSVHNKTIQEKIEVMRPWADEITSSQNKLASISSWEYSDILSRGSSLIQYFYTNIWTQQ